MYYTKESIEKIRDLNIVDVVSKYLSLKQAGANYQACSPFTAEKTPSFIVSPAKQIFTCFSTGNSGSAIDFVMLHNKLSFIDAVKQIAADQNVFLEKEQVSQAQQAVLDKKAEFYKLATAVKLKYCKELLKLNNNHWAKTMLAQRGYNQEVITDWQLGFAPGGNGVAFMVKEKGLLGAAKEIGIVSSEDNRNAYDFFRERIIFPIISHHGNVIGFGGRRENLADSKYPKYLNSKESEIYSKGNTLYGLHLAKNPIRQKGFAILTEGYTDVITMHTKGATTTIGSLGTALTENQVKLLANFCKTVFIMRDGDGAGTKAIEKDLQLLLKNGFKALVHQLPYGEDPDTYAHQFEDVQKQVIENSEDGIIWKAKKLAANMVSDFYLREVDIIEEQLKTETDVLNANKKTTAEINLLELEERRRYSAYAKQIDKEVEQLNKDAQKRIQELVKVDPHKKEKCTTEISQLLFFVKNEVTRETYINQVAKIMETPAKFLKLRIAAFEKQKQEDYKNLQPTAQSLGLPDGCNKEHAEFFVKYRFLEFNKQYYFQKKTGLESGSNMIIKPLYHINGKDENKRLCEVENVYGQRELIDFESVSFVSLSELRRELITKGNYLFTGIGNTEFELITQRLMSDFDEALPLVNLGQNAKGFFAFANGIVKNNGKFEAANKYGVIHVPSENTVVPDEFKAFTKQIEYYYTPAFSAMHRDNQKGDDPYENDRKFIYKQAPITLQQWQKEMINVFGDKGKIGIVFTFASLFRDVFLDAYSYFPLLGGFGEKGTGKSGFGECLQAFFFTDQRPLDLTQATPVGFSRRVARVKNAITFLDEYKENGVDDRLKSGMMGAWNGNGREKGTLKKGATETDIINCALYISGQFLPTYQDNALAERMVVLNFPSKAFTEQEKIDYNQFIQTSKEGLSSLILEILAHRKYFKKELLQQYIAVGKDLKKSFKTAGIKERIIQNYLALLTTYKILSDKINFEFDYEDFKKLCIKGIQLNSESIQDSDTTMEFWKTIQHLYEHRIIKEGYQFAIDNPPAVTIMVERTAQHNYNNENRKDLLFLRLNAVHPDYSKHCQQTGKEILNEGTLRGYLKSRPYYIGAVKSKRFKNGASSSCLVFDYSMMSSDDSLIISLPKMNYKEDVPDGTEDFNPKETQNTQESKLDNNNGVPF